MPLTFVLVHSGSAAAVQLRGTLEVQSLKPQQVSELTLNSEACVLFPAVLDLFIEFVGRS